MGVNDKLIVDGNFDGWKRPQQNSQQGSQDKVAKGDFGMGL